MTYLSSRNNIPDCLDNYNRGGNEYTSNSKKKTPRKLVTCQINPPDFLEFSHPDDSFIAVELIMLQMQCTPGKSFETGSEKYSTPPPKIISK